jgi:cellulose synthase/poly-beta-1,6-N-acetylglucosamine synthase-like glycosyltransferase
MGYILWASLFIIFYSFFGYGILLYILVKLRRAIKGRRALPDNAGNWPTLTVVVSAYNEEGCIAEKIHNTLSLDYPADKVQYLFVTDGSTDATPNIIGTFQQIKLMHAPERRGKIAAMERAMHEVKSEIVIFTDANTMLNKRALLNICRHYHDPTVGGVSGEKRVRIDDVSDATAGEGFYWKYESALKKWDSELHTVVGAAGELFSVRTSLYKPVQPDTVLDDFMISMHIAEEGYRVIYEPEAYATEAGSENIEEELKRKIRIAAGGIQAISRLKKAINPFHNPTLTFQYISHRVLRWTVTPFLMIFSFWLNAALAYQTASGTYIALFYLQAAFYVFAIVGWIMERKQVRIKTLFIPYYFCMMNYAIVAGIQRHLLVKQSVMWEKAKRKQ